MPYHFYNTICGLRQQEELVLYDRMITFIPEDEQLVTEFLGIEYETENINYPFTAPPFNAAAALWAAKTTYTFGQLILYREHTEIILPQLLPAYEGTLDAGSILSADLCLRFLPELIPVIRNIDSEDSLLQLLKDLLKQWQYSAIGYEVNATNADLFAVTENDCLLQLYADRVIAKKDMQKAMQPVVLQKIKASLGLYTPTFWKELNTAIENEQ